MSLANPVRWDRRIARNVPFGIAWTHTVAGLAKDLTGYSAEWRWRLYEGQPDSPKLVLATVQAPIHGLYFRPLAGIIEARLDWAQVPGPPNGLPDGVPTGDPSRPDDLLIYHDLIVTDPNGVADRWRTGIITLHSGA